MVFHRLRPLLGALVAGVGLAGLAAAPPGAPKGAAPLWSVRLKADAVPGADARQMFGAVVGPARGPWKPRVDREVARGTEELYAKVAPAVVVVRTASGHGTGFVVEPSGWVVTNHHVIARAEVDADTGAPSATVYFGRLKEGLMKLEEKGVPALVYKSSAEKDLALLKLARLPGGVKALPVIKLAKSAPRPGADCMGVGHPRAGLLWSVRNGTVTGVGRWPEEMIRVVMTRLALKDEADRKRLDAVCKKARQMKVVLSSCGMNPGDSGGPLVNAAGELIGVTFAVPSSEGGPRVDKFTYHVHLDEVRAFLKDRPGEPLVDVPDPWPPALFTAVWDLDGDGVPDTLVCGAERGKPATGLLFDLKQSSVKKYTREELATPARGRTWDFQLALHLGPERRAFYDTDGDGKIDLVLVDRDGDGKVDAALRRKKGKWVREDPGKYKLLDPSLLPDRACRERFARIVRGLMEK